MFALALMPALFGQNQPARSKPVFLDQGWSEEDRLKYYFTSQASAVMFYDIFLNLEVANAENWLAPLTPVEPSFVWIGHSAWARWSGILSDPLIRNLGEAMGVFVRMDLTSKTPTEGLFDSTVDIKGLIDSEDLLWRLAPPQWPEEVLGKVDQEKAAKGAQLFKENCAGRHSTWPHRWSEPKKE